MNKLRDALGQWELREDCKNSSLVYDRRMRKTNLLGALLMAVALVATIVPAQAYPVGCGWGGGSRGGYVGGWGGYHGGGWGYGGGCYNGGWGGGYWPAVAAGAIVAGAAAIATAPLYQQPVVYAPPVTYAPQVVTTYAPEVIRPVRVVHEGDSTLAAAQSKLAGLGYYKGSVDGVFGMQTQAALFQFQSGNSLPVTGVLDLKTQAALGLAH